MQVGNVRFWHKAVIILNYSLINTGSPASQIFSSGRYTVMVSHGIEVQLTERIQSEDFITGQALAPDLRKIQVKKLCGVTPSTERNAAVNAAGQENPG